MKKGKKFSLSTTQLILLSFLGVILAGTLLLCLPFSSATGESIGFVDALFTATTATCVTGLVTVPTVSAWSTFGQIVILLLIQVGGLGVITVISVFMYNATRKPGVSGNMLLQDAFNLNTLSGLSEFVKRVVKGTILVELLGTLGYITVFVPDFGLKGIWISLFTAVSAFCNAGIDIIAEDSLCSYGFNPVINAVTCLLIILGGIGYIVWWDVIRVVKLYGKQGIKCLRRLTLHSKIAVSASLIFIFSGAVLIFISEYENPLTVGDRSLWDKLQFSLFQSITTRTAGFATVPQENMSEATAFICMLMMFVGGSPVGTAGGIKTVTVVVLIASACSAIRGRNRVNLFSRSITSEAVSKALAVFCTSMAVVVISTVLLSLVCNRSLTDVLYESVSATATVGLTRGLTPSLNLWGKLIITATMYLGRVGPVSLALAFNLKTVNRNAVKNPYEEISVG